MKRPDDTSYTILLVILGFFAVAAVFYACSPKAALNPEVTPQGQIVWNQATATLAVSTSDTTALSPNPTRFLYNGNASACNIAVKLSLDSAAVTLNNVQPGAALPVAAVFVMATNTTCSNIVALY
jgi:hypothetical protein